MNNVIEKLGLKIIRNAPEEMLTELGVRQWTIWSCPPSEFQWIYGSKETCYILEGKVKIIVKDESVEIVAGDLVVFPKGLSCTWDILVAVDKHFSYA
ncbi:uncharacterized protein LOC106764876 [Vigna radiata var. radiata]|uniref:Uncharacterized protein LOC106764876 n=1 Tax=Vigna radiata var. radiata TaxID=3916 RepID=A0A1S3UFI4_VIGRR|nr:uncharacterized protein LOC106764876 [Vigna radiata var. radiata]